MPCCQIVHLCFEALPKYPVIVACFHYVPQKYIFRCSLIGFSVKPSQAGIDRGQRPQMLFMNALCETLFDNSLVPANINRSRVCLVLKIILMRRGFVVQWLRLWPRLRKRVEAGGTKGCVSFRPLNQSPSSVAALGEADLGAGAHIMAHGRGAETNCPGNKKDRNGSFVGGSGLNCQQ